MSQMTVDQALQHAIQQQKSGDSAGAQDVLRQILGAYPDQADALHLMGAIAYTSGRTEEGETLVRRALAISPGEPLFENTLGVILMGKGQNAEAVELYRRVVQVRGRSSDMRVNYGAALMAVGRHNEAIAEFQEALRLSPGDLKAEMNLGITLCQAGRFEEAVWVVRSAIQKHPRVADLHAALGAALYKTGQWEAAVAASQEAVRLDPKSSSSFSNLSLALAELGRLEDAAEAAKRAAELLPEIPDVQINYGEAMRRMGDFDECERAYRGALARHPNTPSLHNNLGNLLGDQCRFAEAMASYRRAIELDPTNLGYYSNMLYTLQFYPGITPEESYAEHRKFDAAMCAPLRGTWRPHVNDPAPGKRIRVGYISTEFRAHSLGFYLTPLLMNHDHGAFEIVCYADVSQPDFLTFRMRQQADKWVDIRGWTDEALAERIRADGIDVLVDLHLHMSGSRALVFARKPAPVQVAFAGYPGTSGVSATDYRLTDHFLEPEEGPEVPSAEKVLRELHTFWCYVPQAEVAVGPLPAEKAGVITFGNLNNFKKLNEATLVLWGRVMREVPGSRLKLLAAVGSHRKWATEIMERQGVAGERLTFIERAPTEKYLAEYGAIDIGLDSFPYNGHTTSLDSFWMGVPVVTMIGRTPVSRAGWSQLKNLGMEELAAADEEGFVRVAVELARDRERLRNLRAELRGRMQASPLMDGKLFARDVERGYRRGWEAWCAEAAGRAGAMVAAEVLPPAGPGGWIGL